MPQRRLFETEAEYRIYRLAKKREYARRAKERRYGVSQACSNRNIVRPRDRSPPDAAALIERARAIAAGPQSIVAEVCGDPLPGRSALDRKHRN